jgi:hypothetical protein
MMVEVGARDSLWTYIAGHWVCEEIDYVEYNLASDITTTSAYSTFAATGIETNIITPVSNCELRAHSDFTLFIDNASSASVGGLVIIRLNGSLLVTLGQSYASTITDIVANLSGGKTAIVAAGSANLALYWCRNSGSPTLRNTASSQPDNYIGNLRVKLSGRIKA